MKTLKLFVFAFLIVTISSFAQEKGIYLINKKSNDSTLIAENLRLKVVTNDGKRTVGVFKIIDAKTISINENLIPIEKIAKIRRASMLHSIADPIGILIGSGLLIGGLDILLTGGYYAGIGWIGILPGIPILAISLIKNNHKASEWNYKIKN